MNRRTLLAGPGLALLAGRASWGQGAASPEPLAGMWVRAIPQVVALAVSPDGSRIVAATAVGDLRCYDERGLLVWEAEAPHVERVAVARRGAVTLGYAPRAPLDAVGSLFGPTGKPLGALRAPGPVEHAGLSADGGSVALATEGQLVLGTLTPRGLRVRAARLDGPPTQVQMGAGGAAYVATRNPDSVVQIGTDGKLLWRRAEPARRAYSISASEDGRTLALAAERDPGLVETALITGRNEARWLDSRPGRRPRVRLAAGGGAPILSYEHRFEHQGQVRYEQRLAYLGPGAGGGWPKGGSFSAPLFVAIEREGEWVVALDTQDRRQLPRFRLYGRGGERRWFYTATAPVLLAAACGTGRNIAVYRSDGFLELLRVSLPGGAPAPTVAPPARA